MDTIHKIGRRKTAVARVYVSDGKGTITVNKKDYKNYFTTPHLTIQNNAGVKLN